MVLGQSMPARDLVSVVLGTKNESGERLALGERGTRGRTQERKYQGFLTCRSAKKMRE